MLAVYIIGGVIAYLVLMIAVGKLLKRSSDRYPKG